MVIMSNVQGCTAKELTKFPHRSIAPAPRSSAVIQYSTLVQSVSFETGGLVYVLLNVTLKMVGRLNRV
jgi:hypothetical protein